MNQFELFVAHSESARSDAWRHVRRLRELDTRIDEVMRRLREIAAHMSAADGVKGKGGGRRNGNVSRKRERKSDADNVVEVVDVDDISESDAEVRSEASVVSLEEAGARLFWEYRTCRRRAERYAVEREKVAEELRACGDEINEYFAVHMAQLRKALRAAEGGSSS